MKHQSTRTREQQHSIGDRRKPYQTKWGLSGIQESMDDVAIEELYL